MLGSIRRRFATTCVYFIPQVVYSSKKMKTIVDIFLESTDRFKDNIAFQMVSDEKEEAVFYFKLRERVEKISCRLQSLGIKKKERIAILSENRPEWSYAYFAILATGAVAVGIDINLKPQEILFILNDADVSGIFISGSLLNIVQEIKENLSLKNVICFDNVVGKDCFCLSDISENNVPSFCYKEISSNDLAMLIYTSGTTGKSKAVMLSHGNISSNVFMIRRILRWETFDNFLSLLPLSHTFELTCGLLCPLYSGAKITYINSLKPANIIAVMQKTKVTHAMVVPGIIRLLQKEIIKQVSCSSELKKVIFYLGFGLCACFRVLNINLGKIIFLKIHQKFGKALKFFVSGGAPLSAYLAWWFDCLGITVLQGYGLTETSPVVSANTPLENRIGSVGKPLPGVEVKIGEGLKEGEILVKGENVLIGYYKNPEETKEAIRDGWFHTGDIGKIDSHGFLYILGREKNVIVRESGLKVYPEEIEEEMLKIPLIRDACIVGKREPGSLEELVYALIVPDEEYMGLKLSDDKDKMSELISVRIKELNSRLAAYKHIHAFELRDDLPKTATKKVKKELVKETLYKHFG